MAKRITVLLGSGSSLAWGSPTSNKITQVLDSDLKFKAKDGSPLFSSLRNIIAKYYKVDVKEINFEQCIHLLDVLISYYRISSSEHKIISSHKFDFSTFEILSEVSDLFGYEFIPHSIVGNPGIMILDKTSHDHIQLVDEKFQEATFLFSAMQHYIVIINNLILAYDNPTSIEKHPSLNNNLCEMFKYLKNAVNSMRVYTLNYDRLWPRILGQCLVNQYEGTGERITPDDELEKLVFDLKRIINDRNCDTFYNLHGCVSWEHNYNSLSYSSEFVFNSDFTMNTGASHSIISNPQEETSIYNIVTGFSKVQRTNSEPLYAMHNSFYQDCMNSDMIITIGYSFFDFHVNRRLANAIRYNSANWVNITFGNPHDEFSFSHGLYEIEKAIHVAGDSFIPPNLAKNSWIISNSNRHRIFIAGFEDFLKKEAWKEIPIS